MMSTTPVNTDVELVFGAVLWKQSRAFGVCDCTTKVLIKRVRQKNKLCSYGKDLQAQE